MTKRINKLPALNNPENKCDRCVNSICCNYITQHIPTPRSKHDFEHLLWQVSHDHVEIYKDDDGWMLLIKGRCEHLQIDGRCGIYPHRPDICRNYTNDFCEYDSPAEDDFKLHFRDYHQLLDYCKQRFKRWDKG